MLFGTCGLLVLLYVFNLDRSSPNRSNEKLKEVWNLASTLPVFPGFTEVGSNVKSGYTVVDVTKHYASTANFHDVKEFYATLLNKDGWILVNGDAGMENSEVTFKRGQFSISIFNTNTSSVYNYAIDFVWRYQ